MAGQSNHTHAIVQTNLIFKYIKNQNTVEEKNSIHNSKNGRKKLNINLTRTI